MMLRVPFIAWPRAGAFCFLAVCVLFSGAAWPYQEAPMLAERVAKGKLPPVDQRLPVHPAVVDPVNQIGKYGGTWRRLAAGSADFGLNSRLGYEPLVRWDRSGRKVAPGLAESYEVRDGGRTYVLRLREGARWSDGHPFTSEDLMFWFEDVLQNKDLTPIFPSWLMLDDQPVVMSAPDAGTIEFRFTSPYGIFLEYVAFMGNAMHFPKHYLQQFHPKYAPIEEIERLARKRGLSLWYQLFGRQSNLEENPELPSMKAFVLKTEPPAMRVVCERNPYYWKVDPEGNQLPYLDQLAYMLVQNGEILNIKAMSGEADFQDRRIDSANYPLFMGNRKKCKYGVRRDPNPCATVIYLNQFSKDPVLRPILQDRRFRIALSVAVNRKELIDLIYSGMAHPARGVASPFDPYYLPEFDQKYLEYDPEQANRLLDEAGLVRGRSGMRHLPEGKPFRQVLNIYPSEIGTGIELWQLVQDYWREVGLEFSLRTDAPTLSTLQVSNGNSDFWGYATSGLHWVVDPVWYTPWDSRSYFAPQFGRYHATSGKYGEKPPEEYQRLLDWYRELRATVDNDAHKLELGQRILGQWAEQCYTIGICCPEIVTIISNRFKNVPEKIIHDYRVMTPGYIGIEQFYIDEE